MSRKILSLLLAVVLALGLCTGASAATAAQQEAAMQFYAPYELRVYDWEKPAVCFGSYIEVGNYECQVFYAADGYIIGVIFGDWPAVEWQQQIDHFNAYRGLPSVKGYFPDGKSMRDSGILIYSEGIDAGIIEPLDIAAEIQSCLDSTNRKRAEAGADPLVMEDTLMDFAAVRAQEIQQLFSHTRPDGTPAVSRANRVSAENIYATGAMAGVGERATRAWFNSDGHRKNMLNSRYTRIGIGCWQAEYGETYWVQVFA